MPCSDFISGDSEHAKQKNNKEKKNMSNALSKRSWKEVTNLLAQATSRLVDVFKDPGRNVITPVFTFQSNQ